MTIVVIALTHAAAHVLLRQAPPPLLCANRLPSHHLPSPHHPTHHPRVGHVWRGHDDNDGFLRHLRGDNHQFIFHRHAPPKLIFGGRLHQQ